MCVRVYVCVCDDDCFYYHSWRNNVVIAFGTLSSCVCVWKWELTLWAKHGPVCHKSVCFKLYKSYLKPKNISTCLLWFSWWLCTKIPRRCDTENNVEKVTQLVGLWIWSPWLWDDISKRSRFERDTLCCKGFQTYAKRSAVTMCVCWGHEFRVIRLVQPP